MALHVAVLLYSVLAAARQGDALVIRADAEPEVKELAVNGDGNLEGTFGVCEGCCIEYTENEYGTPETLCKDEDDETLRVSCVRYGCTCTSTSTYKGACTSEPNPAKLEAEKLKMKREAEAEELKKVLEEMGSIDIDDDRTSAPQTTVSTPVDDDRTSAPQTTVSTPVVRQFRFSDNEDEENYPGTTRYLGENAVDTNDNIIGGFAGGVQRHLNGTLKNADAKDAADAKECEPIGKCIDKRGTFRYMMGRLARQWELGKKHVTTADGHWTCEEYGQSLQPAEAESWVQTGRSCGAGKKCCELKQQ